MSAAEEWEVREADGQTYYENMITGETSWEVPEDLTNYDATSGGGGGGGGAGGAVVDAAWQEDTTGYEWNEATQSWEEAGDWDPMQQPEWNAMATGATGMTGTSYGGASGYDASADGGGGGMETGYFGEDGMWYDGAEEGGGGGDYGGDYDAEAGGYDGGGYYGDDGVWYEGEGGEEAGYYGDDGQWYAYAAEGEEAAGDYDYDATGGGGGGGGEEQGYWAEDGQWYAYETGGEGAGDDAAQQGYWADDGQWYSYDEGAGELYEEGAAAIEEEAAAPEELQEPVAGGPGYVVVTVLRARGLRKVRIAFPPRGEKKEKESPIMNLLPLIHDSLFPFLFSAHAPTHPHTQRNALS